MTEYDFTPEDIDEFSAADLTPAQEANLRRSFSDGLKAIDTFLALPVDRPATGADMLRATVQLRGAKLAGKMAAGISSMMEARGWSS